MTQNKGIGMTDIEWNEIVLRNVQREKDEAEQKKQSLVKQREQMKLELENQVKLKKIKELEAKNMEKSQFELGIQLIEQ